MDTVVLPSPLGASPLIGASPGSPKLSALQTRLLRVAAAGTHLRAALIHSRLGVFVDVADVLLSLLFCVAYIAETHFEHVPFALAVVNVWCTAVFSGYFLLCLLVSRQQSAFLRSAHTILDMISIFALVPLLWYGRDRRSFNMQLWRLLAVTRVSHLDGLERFVKRDVDRQVFLYVQPGHGHPPPCILICVTRFVGVLQWGATCCSRVVAVSFGNVSPCF